MSYSSCVSSLIVYVALLVVGLSLVTLYLMFFLFVFFVVFYYVFFIILSYRVCLILFLVFWIAFVCIFVFFKQSTASEMRISDWSSDVCSSDLGWVHLRASSGTPAGVSPMRAASSNRATRRCASSGATAARALATAVAACSTSKRPTDPALSCAVTSRKLFSAVAKDVRAIAAACAKEHALV